jgi:putative long chain acyl-CoA synthase
MDLVPRAITGPVGRLGAAAQNALEVARFGGLETGDEHSPYEVFSEHRVYRLRRYFPSDTDGRPAVVLVPPMMLSAEVWDVAPSSTAVGSLHAHGIDPWVVDFGAPEREVGGLERTLTDHVLAVSDAVDRVRAVVGRDVHLGGYSQGGMFCYQSTAYRRSKGIASVITFGSPADTSSAMPFGIPQDVAGRSAAFIADRILAGRALPAWASSAGFRLLDPVKSLRGRVNFIRQLHDREALLPRERQRRFLGGEGFVAWPGPALADFMHQFVVHNRMLSGGFVIEDRLVTLADITCPILYFVGEVDEIAPAPGVRAIARAAPRADVYEAALRAGHFGLVVGSSANRTTWPVVADWAHWREGERGEMPEAVTRPPEDGQLDRAPGAGAVGNRVGYGLGLAANVGAGMARSIATTATRSVRSARELTREAAGQLPRLARLEQITPSTRISLGLLLDEQARRGPDEILFLFEDRAHTRAAAKARVDAVVRGLISLGVRQGEHVGVLMSNRPSSLAVVAALNRLGAVAVLLRPDADLAREAELGQIDRVVADPERAELAKGLGAVHTFVLGGGGEERDLGPGVTDMERIDPDEVELPAWYRANPGRASDVAFILFSGEGAGTKVNRITNRRWALSAFGTASSAALSRADTVYSVTPLYHPSGLLMTIGGALAGDARIAMTTAFDPATFWEEVRRYGVTIASYTWTGLHDLVEAPPNPSERHHPIRLFIGSGMPRGLWRRVEERFAPARVVEFWASTEGDAILVNLSGAKPGSMGRPLPGSAGVRVAAYDPDRERLVEGPDGLAIECGPGEVGMLLARARPGPTLSTSLLRGVFAREDAWLVTGDLFERDADGDYWLVSSVRELIHTANALVPPRPISDALGDLPAVDLAVAYGVPGKAEGTEIAVAAVTLREGRELEPADVNEALAGLDPADRSAVVHVVDEIPVTTWHRPITGALRAAGIPPVGSAQAWFRDPAKDAYRPLTAAARKRLVGEG